MSKHLKNKAPKNLSHSQKRFQWRDVSQALEHPGARSVALTAFAKAGFNADRFATDRKARVFAGVCLTQAEDWLEMHTPRYNRTAIRKVRRGLESEL